MNRNDLFRKSLLSTAVVAVLHAYSMGAAAAPCPAPVDGGITISSGETCDSITISDSNLANDVSIKGTVTGDVINTADLNYLQIKTGSEGERQISGSIINRGIIHYDETEDASFIVGSYEDPLLVDGDVANEGTATYFQVGRLGLGGDLINSGTLTDDFLYVFESDITGSVVNRGDIGSEENSVYDAIWVESTAVGVDIRNESTIFTDNSGILIADTEVGGNVTNSGDITIYTHGDDYAQEGLFGIRVTNSVPSDEFEGEERIVGPSIIAGSVINSGTITITNGNPDDPALIEDMAGGIFVGVERASQDTPAAYVTGDVINTGEILEDINNHEYGESFGILIEHAIVGGRVGNVGEDSVISSSRAGIVVQNDSEVGDIVNEGSISVTEFWDGIYVDASTAASVSNTGLITTTAGAGINVSSSTISGTVRNDGLIDASGGFAEYQRWDNEEPTPPEYIEGTGIYLSAYTICDDGCVDVTSTTGSIINGINGEIIATEAGIDVDSATINGDIINQGNIYAEALGIYADSATISGDVINSGLIEGAEGIYLESSEIGTTTVNNIINDTTGEIAAEYLGIALNEIEANSVVNNGLIEVEIPQEVMPMMYDNSYGSGIYIRSSDIAENVTNNGDIDVFGTGIALDSWGEGQTTVQYVLNNADATIEAGNDGISLMEVDGSGIVNLGTITSYNGLGIYSSGSNLSDGIYNDGQIISDGPGIIAEGYSPEESVQVSIIANDENGVITAEYGPGIGAFAVEGESLANTGTINAESGIMAMLSTLTDGVVNTGTINADWAGIQLDTTQAGTVANQGTINVSDEYGTAISISGSELTTGVYNSGTLNAGEGILVSGYPGFGPILAVQDLPPPPPPLPSEPTPPEEPLFIGTVVNDESGVINATAEDSYGIGLDFVKATGLGNAGIINADYGLYVYGSTLTEDIVNTGIIQASEVGVSVEDSQISGNISNSGLIQAIKGIYLESWGSTTVNNIVNDTGGEINADYVGIGLRGIEANSIVNKGVIKITEKPDDIELRGIDYSDGTGIYVAGGSIESGITNSGEISARNNGIIVDGFYDYEEPVNAGFILNDESGVINAGDEGAGIGVGYVYADTLKNDGTINGGSGLVSLESMFANDIINTGTINVKNYAIAVSESEIEGIVGNTGVITARAENEDNEGTGIFIADSVINGGVINTGVINADINGIHINGELNGDILNTGTISSDQGAAIYASFGADHDGSVENYGSITGGDDGKTVTAIDYSDAFAPLTLVQEAGQIIGNIWGSSENSGDSAYIDGGSITGDLHDIEGIYVDGVTTLDGNVYGGTFINIESSGNLTLTGEARSFESDLNLHGGTLSLNISNETDPAEAMLSTEGDIYLSSNSRLIITASQNLEVNLDPVDYLALSGNALSHNGVTVESGSAIITAELAEITVNSLSVTVATNDFGQVIESVGATGNEVQVIDAYMQEYIASSGGECNAICQAIEQAETAEELAAIAEEMVPDSSGVVGASQAAQSETLGAVFKRIAGFRSSVSGVSSGDNIEPGSLWMQALASDGDQDAVQYQGNDFDGYSYRTRGFTIGADADLSDTLTAGLAVTYGVTKSDVEGSANRSETDSYLLTAYGSWRQQDYFMDSSIAFGVSRSDIEQYTANVKSTADSDAAQVALRLVTGRTFAFNDNDTIVEPQVAFNYSRVDTDSYTLQPLNMEVLDQRIETVELGAGLRAMTAIDTKRGLLIPEVNLMAWHDFAADRGDTAARFLTGAGNSFVTTGAKPEQTNYQAGLGVQYWLNNNVSLSANYDRNWNSNFSADTWLANIRYDF
ncbi:autotransporter outer membrane beta-barrel domain-containing protein [Endozoicomonas atrinae]|uniref:autotransporter outer membrane beta-barrel domain-containing protein n=1 Tax=Endozoicomonas atrinae TaxID=1333660 RepID=UPI0008266B12|nr:autotransporter outer membrane beta-barrel domain-containing protein [Endozoicomonas atrinae]